MSRDKSWLQCICHTTKKASQTLEKVFEGAGALSITWQDAKDNPVLEPLPGETPLWDSLVITALFEADADLTALTDVLDAHRDDWEIQQYSIEPLQDQVWERVWMKDYHPMKFGDNLWIYPSNHPMPDDNSVKIHLDPGLAFGTGTHPTTALCLEWLDQNPPHQLDVFDYGCGSGVLAIAAAKLGAKHIVATDIDPQGLTATLDNMQRNDIPDSAIERCLPEDCPDAQADLMIANILCGPLIELHPQLSALTKKNGLIVLSGILSEQQESIIETYSSDFKNFDVKILDNWVRISATKK